MLGTSPDKSLFEIMCDSFKKTKQEYGVNIPWYIMTSRENNEETINFFENNNYFGYSREDIKFFMQGELAMTDIEGKLLLDENGLVKEAADGHGGVFEAMFKNDVVSDMQKRKIEWIFIGPVDNPLVNMIDDVAVGVAIDKNYLSVGKSLLKKSPEERVGIFCKKNGKPSVVEYTEISEEMANERDGNGTLVYGESHINCNIFNIKAVEKIGAKKLPYHSAFKKAKYMNNEGEIIEPTEPNSYKFESFIFDSFEEINSMVILRVERKNEFAPVKNGSGEDSPETARELYNNFHNKNL